MEAKRGMKTTASHSLPIVCQYSTTHRTYGILWGLMAYYEKHRGLREILMAMYVIQFVYITHCLPQVVCTREIWQTMAGRGVKCL